MILPTDIGIFVSHFGNAVNFSTIFKLQVCINEKKDFTDTINTTPNVFSFPSGYISSKQKQRFVEHTAVISKTIK